MKSLRIQFHFLRNIFILVWWSLVGQWWGEKKAILKGKLGDDISTYLYSDMKLIWDTLRRSISFSRVVTVRKKYLENEIFFMSENFVDGQRNLERTPKSQFENNWLWQAVKRKFMYSVQEGKEYTFSCDSISTSPSTLGAILKGKNLLPWEQILFFKRNPQIWSDTVNTIKVKFKNDFFNLSEGMENCKMSGKIREKSGNFEVDDKWQAWFSLLSLFSKEVNS